MNFTLKIRLLLIYMLVNQCFMNAQTPIQDHTRWKRSIGGTQGSSIISTCATADKGVALLSLCGRGDAQQYKLTKLNAQGTLLWDYFFENQLFEHYDLYPSFIEIEPDEFILAVSNRLIRCNALGKVKYSQKMQPVDGYLQTNCITILNPQTIAVCGVSYDWNVRSPQVWYALYTPQLQLIAQQKIILPLKYEPNRAMITPLQQLVISGMEKKDTLACKAQKDTYCKKMFLRSWSLQGVPVWEVSFDQSHTPTFMKSNAQGATLLTYSGGKKGQSGFTANFMKVSAQGKVLQDIQHITQNGQDQHNHFEDVVETDDNGFLLVGTSSSLNRTLRNYNSEASTDFLAVKLDAQGKMQWEQEWGGSEDEGASFIVKSIDNQYIMIGHTQSIDWDVIDPPKVGVNGKRPEGWIWCVGISDR